MTMLKSRLEIDKMFGWDDVKNPSTPRFTYEDFLCFPEDGLRHELIDGEHYVTPSPNTHHQRLVGRLHADLYAHLSATQAGEVFLAPFDVVLSNHDVVEPDLLVILADQAGILTDQNVRGAPAIVVEVLSPGTRHRDETLKRQLYDRVGVREYWLVDADAETILVCRRADAGDLSRVVEFQRNADDRLRSAWLPGFELSLRRLFGAAPRT